MTRVVEQAKADGYVTTLFGRRRDLPELKSSNFNLRSFGERVALNMPIQGTAADIIKAAMVRVDARMRARRAAGAVAAAGARRAHRRVPRGGGRDGHSAILIDEMEHVVDYRVPLLVDAKIGASWAEAH
ncbi:MAG: DNA polymerase [Oscillospiraceae bacterium]